MIKYYTEIDENEIYNYYLLCVCEDHEFVLIEKDDFFKILHQSTTFVFLKEEKIEGLIMTHQKDLSFYITHFFGNHQRKTDLLERLIKHLKTMGIKDLWVHFFNPISIAWYLKEQITHPCYQGVPKDEKMHQFYRSNQFKEHSVQDTFYMSLDNFVQDKNIEETKNNLISKGITFDIFDSKKHLHFNEFLDEIDAPHWKKTLQDNENQSLPMPLLVALDHENVIGFAGPLMVEKSGRGYFAGIGLIDRYQGQKIGKVLFHELIIRLKNLNAKYMTLFTGRENKARHIYMGAGFEIIRSFVTLKLDL